MPALLGNFIIALALNVGAGGLLPALGAAAIGSAVLSVGPSVGAKYGAPRARQ